MRGSRSLAGSPGHIHRPGAPLHPQPHRARPHLPAAPEHDGLRRCAGAAGQSGPPRPRTRSDPRGGGGLQREARIQSPVAGSIPGLAERRGPRRLRRELHRRSRRHGRPHSSPQALRAARALRLRPVRPAQHPCGGYRRRATWQAARPHDHSRGAVARRDPGLRARRDPRRDLRSRVPRLVPGYRGLPRRPAVPHEA